MYLIRQKLHSVAFIFNLDFFYINISAHTLRRHPAKLMFLGILKTLENYLYRSFGWTEIT